MYDQQTHSLWNQFTGEPVTGDLAFSGIRLKTLPVAVTTWAAWVAANPETTVLSLNTGFRRDYGSGIVYRDYFSSPRPDVPDPCELGRRAEELCLWHP